MFGRLLVSFFATVAWMTLVSALVPPDPIITAAAVLPRQNAAEFVGWRKINGTCKLLTIILSISANQSFRAQHKLRRRVNALSKWSILELLRRY
jgi:hypothetical protein